MIHYIENNKIAREVLNSKNKLVMVYFFANWCMPCEEQNEVLNDFDSANLDDVVIFKVNLDEDNETKIRYNIQSIPTIIFFENGIEIERIVGLINKQKIQQLIEELK